MKIIPAIDIIEGKCVRLSEGDYNTKKIYGDPFDIAETFRQNGIRYLHLVDLDGAKAGKVINLKTVVKICSTGLTIDFGGGVKSRYDLESVFDAGVSKVTLGSIAVENPTLCREWIVEFGADKFILGADCLNRKIRTSGWLNNSDLDVIEFIKSYQNAGMEEVICTDISKDGMLAGPSMDLYTKIFEKSTMKAIASGGISSVEDLEILRDIGCSGAIIGKAIYENKITLDQLQQFI